MHGCRFLQQRANRDWARIHWLYHRSSCEWSTKCLKRHMQRKCPTWFSQCRFLNLQVLPQTTLIDEIVAIQVSSLQPGQAVTIRSYFDDEDRQFEAHAHYVGDEEGRVSVAEHQSQGGTYTGKEPMGLFWGMAACPWQRVGTRYMKRDVTKPLTISISVHNGHMDADTAREDTSPLERTAVERWYMGPNVERFKVNAGRLRGTVLKPKGTGPFPAVIDMFGGVLPGTNEIRAALLANHGFAAYSLSYFGEEGLYPVYDENTCLELEYFEEALDWFSSQPYVQQSCVGVVGICKGAEIAVAMAVNLADKCKTNVSGTSWSCIKHLCPFSVQDKRKCCTDVGLAFNTFAHFQCKTNVKATVAISTSTGITWNTLSYKGRCFPTMRVDFSKASYTQNGGVILKDAITDILDGHHDHYQQKFENITNPIIFFAGEKDEFYGTKHSQKAMERMKAHGRTNYEWKFYPGAGHLIEPPYAPVCIEAFQNQTVGLIHWGGIPKYHAHACEDAWQLLLKFLKTNLNNR